MRRKIEHTCAVHPAGAQLADAQRRHARQARVVQEDAGVDVWCLQRGAPHEHALVVDGVHQHVHGGADARLCKALADALLQRHDLIPPRLAHLLRQLLRVRASGRALLGAEGERAQALKLKLFAKVNQLPVVLLTLAGEAANKGAAQRQA